MSIALYYMRASSTPELCIYLLSIIITIICLVVQYPFFIIFHTFIYWSLLYSVDMQEKYTNCIDSYYDCVKAVFFFFLLHYLHGMSSSKIYFLVVCIASCCYIYYLRLCSFLNFIKKKNYFYILKNYLNFFF